MRKKIILTTTAVLILVVAAILLFGGSSSNEEDGKATVSVTRGSIVEKALAVGTIEPEKEISVKSKVSGVVKTIFADAGAFVKAGEPLLELRPDPTPLELAEATRQVQMRKVELENLARELSRQETMAAKGLISTQEYEAFVARYQEVQLQHKLASERLELLEQGRVTIEDTKIESIIKAPITGFVLRKMVEVGDPVTPLTSYQEGTVLMNMANMDRLVFKGTVDEIDVGKLREGMPAELKVGALPKDTVDGSLIRISLKAEKKDNATVFPIEIGIDPSNSSLLRAGYSANANIIIQRKDSILIIPERVVTFRGDSAFVMIPQQGQDGEQERRIETGLSDAISIEVIAGLDSGDVVLEKPLRVIE